MLPAGFAMFLAVGTAAAALHGRLTAAGVLTACAAVAGVAGRSRPSRSRAVLLAGIGWLTVTGFSRPPYAQLRPTGPAAAHAAVVLGVTALAGAGLGFGVPLVLAATHASKHGHLIQSREPVGPLPKVPECRYCANC